MVTHLVAMTRTHVVAITWLVWLAFCPVSRSVWLHPLFKDRAPFHIRAVYQTFESHEGSLRISVFYDKTDGVEEFWTLGTKDMWSPPVDVRPDHFVWSSCSAMKGDRYECEARLRAQKAYVQDGYTFMLVYNTPAGVLMQVEPIALSDGIPREVCACGDPTIVSTVSQPTWYLHPPARVTHRLHEDIHLAWSFEGKFSGDNDHIEVIKTLETPRHIPGGRTTQADNYVFLYREDGAMVRLEHVEVSVARRHIWMGLTPVDVDVIIHGATEQDTGVYSVRFSTEFLSDWGYQWSSTMLHPDYRKSVFPHGRHNPRSGVKVADCLGNLTYNSLPLYPGTPNCLICSAGGANVSLTIKKDGKELPREDDRGNQFRTRTFYPDSSYVYYYFAAPSTEDSAPFVCTAHADGYYVGKAIWVELTE